MGNKKYKLTISLLASNRKDTLPKTLASLKPILDNVSSELIVVDTGCEEDLLEIVRQYTDKIYKFEWCKDFAKARNVGIDNAEGDWFMFIDDDEWFEDVTEFIEFFNSDEMKKYNYGKYVVRNYENMEGTAWTDSIAGRMFRMFEGTKFKDAIHERPVNIAGPTKDFVSYAHHYGYVYKSEEERRAHIKRNMDLLIEQIKREPGCARHYCHLTQEYNTIKEYEKSLECALEGIEKADTSISENAKDLPGLYATVIWNKLNQLKYEEVIDKAKEYLASPYMKELGSMAIYGFASTAAYKLGRFEDSIAYARKFFELNDYLDKNPSIRYSQDAIMITMCTMLENLERIAGIGFAASLMLSDIEGMASFSGLLENGHRALVDAEKCMKKLADEMGRERNHQLCADILKKVILNDAYFNIYLGRVEEIREENIEAFLNIADIMSKIDSAHGYIQFMTIIANRNDSEEKLKALYNKAINDIRDIINLHHHFWSIAASRQIPIADMVASKSVGEWMITVDDWAKTIKIKELIQKKQDLDKVLYTDGMHMKYFDMILVESLMYRKKLDGVSKDEIHAEMVKYANVVMEFYRNIYRDNVFVECPTILPNRCQAAMKFMRVLCGEAQDVEKEMEAVAKLMPSTKALVSKYIELIKV